MFFLRKLLALKKLKNKAFIYPLLILDLYKFHLQHEQKDATDQTYDLPIS